MKLDPTWPLDDLSLISPKPYTLHKANYILCNPYNLTSNLIDMKGHLKRFEILTSTGKGQNRPKFRQDIFLPVTISKLSITHFRQNGTWVLLPLQSSY